MIEGGLDILPFRLKAYSSEITNRKYFWRRLLKWLYAKGRVAKLLRYRGREC